MNIFHSLPTLAGLILLAAFRASSLEIPFTPYKDGAATSSTYSGSGRTLTVRAGDSKAWTVHALPDSGRKQVARARLEVYVKDVVRDGDLSVHLAAALPTLESQTRLSDLRTTRSIGSASLRAVDHIQRMVSIPLGDAFLKAVQDGSYSGIILEGTGGLDAEIGALEGSHGAILHLDFPTATAVLEKGDKGDPGDRGPQGPPGLKGDKGDRGPAGDPTDLDPVFKLFLDRGLAAYYRFDRFSGLPQITPDSSGHGNELSMSVSGYSKSKIAPGDSAVTFSRSGYATAADARSLNPYREITLSAKVRLSTENPPDTQTILSKPNQYELSIIGNRLRCRFRTVLGQWEWLGDGEVPTGTWTEVQATYDGRAVRTFVNGSQKYHRFYPNGPLAVDTTSPLFVGARTANVEGLNGSLDDVKILSYAVGAQDSVSRLPGRVTRDQVVADSVSGLAALLNAKADLTGATFTGPVAVGVTGSTFAEDKTLGRFTHGTSGGRTVDFSVDYRGSSLGDGTLVLREGRAEQDFMAVNMLSTGVGPRVVFPTGNLGIGTNAPDARIHVVGNENSTRIAQDGGSVYAEMAERAYGSTWGLMLNAYKSGDTPGGLFTSGNTRYKRDRNVPGSDRRGAAAIGAYLNGVDGGSIEMYSAPPSDAADAVVSWTNTAVFSRTEAWLSPRGRPEDLYVSKSGRVGLGTTAPEANLQVEANGTLASPGGPITQGLLRVQSNSDVGPSTDENFAIASIFAARVSTTDKNSENLRILHVASDDQDILVVRGNGQVGIGTRTPRDKMDVTGPVHATSFPTDSDRRLKKDIAPIAGSLDKVSLLQGVTYKWDAERHPGRGYEKGSQLGFIAQDVEPIVPELVRTDVDGYKSMDYSRLTPLLVEALKELNLKMDAMQRKVDALETENRTFKENAARRE